MNDARNAEKQVSRSAAPFLSSGCSEDYLSPLTLVLCTFPTINSSKKRILCSLCSVPRLPSALLRSTMALPRSGHVLSRVAVAFHPDSLSSLCPSQLPVDPCGDVTPRPHPGSHRSL
ncbi:hypothetical protein AAY473_019000 [Plecturocebus cupreus]